jgi:hypothetical protein
VSAPAPASQPCSATRNKNERHLHDD